LASASSVQACREYRIGRGPQVGACHGHVALRAAAVELASIGEGPPGSNRKKSGVQAALNARATVCFSSNR
jgi:hypothetical protein